MEQEMNLVDRQIKTTTSTTSSHCKFACGDVIGNFEIEKQLGKGRFSTVWLCKNNKSQVAIKVYRIGRDNLRFYENEVKLLSRIHEYSKDTQTIPQHIVSYLGTFAHIDISANQTPYIHPCVIFGVGHNSLSDLIKYCSDEYENGIPTHVVKKIMRELFTALAYLHQCGIIHADVKPGNILLDKHVEDITGENFSIMLADLGSSTTADNIFSRAIGTTNYLAPELIIDLPSFSYPIDIWSSFTMCFELITMDLLFDVYAECGITYGEDVDCEAIDGLESAMYDGATDGSLSDSSDDGEDEIDEFLIYYRHLLLIAKVLGYPPKIFTENARSYYNRHDRLLNNPDVQPVSLCDLIQSNYDLERQECIDIEKFLLAGLQYLPENRVTAAEALKLPWLI